MWNDGWFTTRSWNNLYNDYELNHCCFGDGGDSGESDDTVDEAFNVSAGAAPAQSAAESAAAAAAAAGVDDVTTDATQEARDDFMEQMEKGDFGYNELEEMGYFDIKDAAVDAAMQAQADKRTEDLAALGIAADINYDPEAGVFSYEAPTFGEAA